MPANMIEQFHLYKDMLITQCQHHPVLLFLSIAVLPSLGFPVSALLVLVGTVLGANMKGCIFALAAIYLNIIWSYFFARGWGRKLVQKMLGIHWKKWSDVDRKNLFRLTCLLRMTPGIPLFVQNYLLGIFAVPLRHYIAISFPITGLYTVGFVLTGGAIMKGNFMKAIAGIAVLCFAVFAVRFFNKKLSNNVG